MSKLSETQEIEKIIIQSYNPNLLQRIKKHYKNNAKTYNICFGLLALAMLLFSSTKTKKLKVVWKR